MNKINTLIWGREFELDVQYDCYTGEEILQSQRDAVSALSEQMIEEALGKVKDYCISINAKEIGTDAIDNIFKYIMPQYLYVPRTSGTHVVAIMCNYRFDQEHGVAVVFEDEKFSKVGKQDIIL